MHFSLILLAISIACSVRLLTFRFSSTWSTRWQHTLGLFLFSPLLLIITATAVLCMGKQGQMLGIPVGKIGYACALGFLGTAAGFLLWRAVQSWRSFQSVQQYPVIDMQAEMQNTTGYLLNTPIPFAAQIGFWHSELVITQGLLIQLSPEQIKAVLTHEQAHAYYRDTFWFFWFGWLRQLTAWLPGTERLWQELLLLRELRADCWAAQRVDPLLVAESLLKMAQAPLMELESSCAAISTNVSLTRLEDRIEALLSVSETIPEPRATLWVWVIPSLIPLLTIILHH